MTQPPTFHSRVSARFGQTVIIFWLLVTTLATFAAKALADEGKPAGGRTVAVTYELLKDAPEGALLGCLRDQSPPLSNFRYAAGKDELAFRINPTDGSIFVVRPDLLNAETQPEVRLSIVADEELIVQDPFLQEFTAGLLEEGLSPSAFRALSTATVFIEITVRLKHVPKCPELADSHFLVLVRDEAAAEFGTVSITRQPVSEQLRYSIVSGNEDDIFQIDGATGALSLRGIAVKQFEMFTTYELLVLVENTAGLSSTASVFVTVVNQIPPVSLIAETEPGQALQPSSATLSVDTRPARAWAGVLPFEFPFGLVKGPRHSITRTSSASATQNSAVTVDQPILPSAESRTSRQEAEIVDAKRSNIQPEAGIPIADRIGGGEVGNLNGFPESSLVTGQTSVRLVLTTPVDPESETETLAVTSRPRNFVLQSVVILTVLLLASVAAVVAWSRAATDRRAAMEEAAASEAARRAETLPTLFSETDGQTIVPQKTAADNAVDACTVSGQEQSSDILAECRSEASASSPTNVQRLEADLRLDQLSEQARQFQEQLADRDRTIEKLTTKLAEVCREFDRPQLTDGGRDSQIDDGSWDSPESHTSENDRRVDGNGDLPQRRQVIESLADARSSLTAAREQLGRQLTQHSLDPDDIADKLTGATDACVVAVLDESDQLRSKFSDLFAMHGALTSEEPVSEQSTLSTAAEQLANAVHESEEGLHLDTVKHYLSDLLARSKDADSADAILVNRRKSEATYGKPDRGDTPERPPRKPVVSFLDSYMKSHGGELAGVADSKRVPVPVEKPEASAEPPKSRAPIDIKSIRESMDSFRAVAIQSVENAVLTYDLRRAKDKIAVRTIIIAILIVVAAIVVIANMVKAIQFSSLSWLMVTAVVLAIAELGLRIQQIRKRQKGGAAILPQESHPKPDGCLLKTGDAEVD